MKNSNPTLSIPLTYPDYEVTVRQKEIARPDGTDTVCIGTLRHNGKPVAAAAPKQRTAHSALCGGHSNCYPPNRSRF